MISTDKRKALKFHGIFRFIDDLCAINDSDEFSMSHQDIYPPELELKVEHQGNHATFLDLDISVNNDGFVYKLFDKRDTFPFFIVRMPYLSSNIPEFIFYGTIKSEVLRIAKNTLKYENFKTRVIYLLTRMKNQGGSLIRFRKCIINVMQKHFPFFQSFSRSSREITNDIITDLTMLV